MMFIIEGLSASGKSTSQQLILKQHPEYIWYDGFSQIDTGFDDWKQFIFNENRVLARLNELNMDKVIIADRLFSEAVYNFNAEERKKFTRFYTFHKARVIFFDAPNNVLQARGTKSDTEVLNILRARYEDMLVNFKHVIIDASKPLEHVVFDVSKYITSEMNSLKKKDANTA